MNQTLQTLTDVLADALNDEELTSEQVVAAIRRELNDSVSYHRKQARKFESALSGLSNDRIITSAPPLASELYPQSAADVDFSDPHYWGYVSHLPGGMGEDSITFGTTHDTLTLS